MALPYQRVGTLGESATILCGSKGATIYTFDVASRALLSSWSHPLSRKSATEAGAEEAVAGDAGEPESDQPPSKKRKLESNGEGSVEGQQGPDAPAESTETAANGKAQGKKKQQKPKRATTRPLEERPFVVLLAATRDGSHVVAVTGQDKAIWVLEHDGKGGLKELSQRYGLCFFFSTSVGKLNV